MAQHDNYDRDVLKALQKIAKHLESIDSKTINECDTKRIHVKGDVSGTGKMPISLRECLLHYTNTGDFVIFMRAGWQIGCTVIDHEDLFIGSINRDLLNEKVTGYRYEKRDWTIKPVMVIDI